MNENNETQNTISTPNPINEVITPPISAPTSPTPTKTPNIIIWVLLGVLIGIIISGITYYFSYEFITNSSKNKNNYQTEMLVNNTQEMTSNNPNINNENRAPSPTPTPTAPFNISNQKDYQAALMQQSILGADKLVREYNPTYQVSFLYAPTNNSDLKEEFYWSADKSTFFYKYLTNTGEWSEEEALLKLFRKESNQDIKTAIGEIINIKENPLCTIETKESSLNLDFQNYSIEYQGVTDDDSSIWTQSSQCNNYGPTNGSQYFSYQPTESQQTFSFNYIGNGISPLVWTTITYGDQNPN